MEITEQKSKDNETKLSKDLHCALGQPHYVKRKKSRQKNRRESITVNHSLKNILNLCMQHLTGPCRFLLANRKINRKLLKHCKRLCKWKLMVSTFDTSTVQTNLPRRKLDAKEITVKLLTDQRKQDASEKTLYQRPREKENTIQKLEGEKQDTNVTKKLGHFSGARTWKLRVKYPQHEELGTCPEKEVRYAKVCQIKHFKKSTLKIIRR